MILISQMRYRKKLSPDQVRNLKYKMPLAPYTSYISLAFLVLVIVLLGFSEDTRVALIVGPIWLIALVVVYYSKGYHRKNALPEKNSDSAGISINPQSEL